MPPERDVEIGRFRPRHMARILEIERKAFAKEAYSRRMFLDLYARCGRLFLIAKVFRRIAGYSVTYVEGGTAEVVSVAVDPEQRRKGVATALLGWTIDRLRECGTRRIDLMVRVDNQPAIRFYRRFGFRRLGEVPGYYGKGGTGLRMRRNLTRISP
jgi:ribosomal-protein-alanine N-acetyltransferase